MAFLLFGHGEAMQGLPASLQAAPRRGNPPLIVSMSLISYHPSGQWLFLFGPCVARQGLRSKTSGGTPEGQPASHRIDVPHLISSLGSMAFFVWAVRSTAWIAQQDIRRPPEGEPASSAIDTTSRLTSPTGSMAFFVWAVRSTASLAQQDIRRHPGGATRLQRNRYHLSSYITPPGQCFFCCFGRAHYPLFSLHTHLCLCLMRFNRGYLLFVVVSKNFPPRCL